MEAKTFDKLGFHFLMLIVSVGISYLFFLNLSNTSEKYHQAANERVFK